MADQAEVTTGGENLSPEQGMGLRSQAAFDALGPIWHDSTTEWGHLAADELNTLKAISQRLNTGKPVNLRQPDAENIQVPLQREYNGQKPVIPSALADIPCSKLESKHLLLCLNTLLYTTYPMTSPLSDVLQHYADTPGVDFGTLYSRIRVSWHKQDFANFEEKRLKAEEDMNRCRQSMVTKRFIKRPEVPPRRFWDLYSNRIITSSLVSRHWPGARQGIYPCDPGNMIRCLDPNQWLHIFAVSHSWARLDERANISTSVNGYQWRVPIPSDVTLERVRVELLNLGAEYAWLDVLCLRQEDAEAEGEKYRKDEWALDVPTIGALYEDSFNVVHYFSGLGKPFVLGDLNSDRHWLNRAWTLQEVGIEEFRTTAGITGDSPPDPWGNTGGSGPFYDTLATADGIMANKAAATNSPEGILAALLSMRVRQCVSPMDRISGLAYPLGGEELPVYDTDWSLERAWEELIAGLHQKSVMMISMLFLIPGEGKFRSLPSWKQVMETDVSAWGGVVDPRCDQLLGNFYPRKDRQLELSGGMRFIPGCRIEGLGADSEAAGIKRQGQATMKTRSGSAMQRPCHSTLPIADGSYDLVSFVDAPFVGAQKEDDLIWMRESVRDFVWLSGEHNSTALCYAPFYIIRMEAQAQAAAGNLSPDERMKVQGKAAFEILGRIWHESMAEWEHLTEEELNAMDAITWRLGNGSPIHLRQPDTENIKVPLQREYTGHKPVIPSVLADIPCSKIGPKHLLLCINTLLYTTYPMASPLSDLLQHYADTPGVDFGTLYSRVRRFWYKQDFDNFEDKRIKAAEDMKQCRQSLLFKRTIKHSDITPRRFWDLYSNRIIDSSLISRHWPGVLQDKYPCAPGTRIHCILPSQWVGIYAVSHSWAPLDERANVSTSINGYEWRVPIPSDASLERVRVELLNMGAEYAWLDVLCLRQEDAAAEGEKYRKDEWALDVPTIGALYDHSLDVVHYFSGLGKPFVLGDLSSDRHWLNRAWTLQEIGSEGCRATAGITNESPPDPWGENGGRGPFYDTLAAAASIMEDKYDSPNCILAALLSMRVRHCMSPMDRISGLAFQLGGLELPVYDPSWSLERAWEGLITGEGKFRFLPSWKQVMESEPSAWGWGAGEQCGRLLGNFVRRKDGQRELSSEMRTIPRCRLEGLGEQEAGIKRQGQATMHTHSGSIMQRPCHSTVPIADGVYDLVSFVDAPWVGKHTKGELSWMTECVRNFVWLVGHIVENRFEKETAMELCDLVSPEDWEEVGHSAVRAGTNGGLLLA
ncbi:hypothetical protein BKA70DRAFT_1408490 [Coprinopsis sp. MPI-PUGE-AT-0042]|nr:hypothetical protein BKA70DRAFT_1408490 [Coprinopsis sp. MPI-PUGE-AT-0042]